MQSVGLGPTATVTAAALSGGTLYAGFEWTTCAHAGCSTSAGVYRTDGSTGWQTVFPNDGRVILATSSSSALWVRTTPHLVAAGEPIYQAVANSSTAVTASTISTAGYATGLALTPTSLFSMTSASDWSSSALYRDDMAANGHWGSSAPLLLIQGPAASLRTNGQALAWAEGLAGDTIVVGDLAGNRRYVVLLPSGSEYTSLEIGSSAAFVAYNQESPTAGAICALDLQTGAAAVTLALGPGIQVCHMAVNSTRLFWTQAAAEGSPCTQVWSQPLTGGMPSILACSAETLGDLLVANDTAVYWIDDQVRHIDPSTL